MHGNSQGLRKIPAHAVKPDPNTGEIVVTHKSSVVTQIDGNQNLGMVVMERAVDEAVLSAKNNGVGIVGTRGTATSTDAIALFRGTRRRARVYLHYFGGTPKAVAPLSSTEAVFGDATHQSGNVVMALGPNVFDYGDSFHERTSSLLENIRNSRPVPGIGNPQVPGEHSRSTFKASKSQDRIFLDLSLVESIRAIAEE